MDMIQIGVLTPQTDDNGDITTIDEKDAYVDKDSIVLMVDNGTMLNYENTWSIVLKNGNAFYISSNSFDLIYSFLKEEGVK